MSDQVFPGERGRRDPIELMPDPYLMAADVLCQSRERGSDRAAWLANLACLCLPEVNSDRFERIETVRLLIDPDNIMSSAEFRQHYGVVKRLAAEERRARRELAPSSRFWLRLRKPTQWILNRVDP